MSVACVNSPVSTTLTGDKEAVEDVQQLLEKASVFNRLLKVDTAYHSHHMRAVAPRYLDALGEGERVNTLKPSQLTFVSSRNHSLLDWGPLLFLRHFDGEDVRIRV